MVPIKIWGLFIKRGLELPRVPRLGLAPGANGSQAKGVWGPEPTGIGRAAKNIKGFLLETGFPRIPLFPKGGTTRGSRGPKGLGGFPNFLFQGLQGPTGPFWKKTDGSFKPLFSPFGFLQGLSSPWVEKKFLPHSKKAGFSLGGVKRGPFKEPGFPWAGSPRHSGFPGPNSGEVPGPG